MNPYFLVSFMAASLLPTLFIVWLLRKIRRSAIGAPFLGAMIYVGLTCLGSGGLEIHIVLAGIFDALVWSLVFTSRDAAAAAMKAAQPPTR